jgi:DNA-binding IclR family transcriptional regulator
MSNVQSIERAFAILETVAAHPEGLGVTEIAHHVDLPKSTVSRLLATLEGVAAVERVSAHEGFQVGAGIIALAAKVPYPRHLVTIARPYLLELAQATGETVNLCLPDGDQAHYVDQVNSQYHIQIQDWTGFRFPLHVVSSGKIFLAYWSKNILEQYLNRHLHSFTPKTIIDPYELRQELITIREQGYAWAVGESEEEVVGLAAPVRDKTGQVMASICVGGPAFRFPPEGKSDDMVRLTVDMANKISNRIGEHA